MIRLMPPSLTMLTKGKKAFVKQPPHFHLGDETMAVTTEEQITKTKSALNSGVWFSGPKHRELTRHEAALRSVLETRLRTLQARLEKESE